MSDPRFIVTITGEVNIEPDPITEPKPDDEDRRKARQLAEGGGFDGEAEDLFARGMAVTRSGGDVRAFLREQLAARRST